MTEVVFMLPVHFQEETLRDAMQDLAGFRRSTRMSEPKLRRREICKYKCDLFLLILNVL